MFVEKIYGPLWLQLGNLKLLEQGQLQAVLDFEMERQIPVFAREHRLTHLAFSQRHAEQSPYPTAYGQCQSLL